MKIRILPWFAFFLSCNVLLGVAAPAGAAAPQEQTTPRDSDAEAESAEEIPSRLDALPLAKVSLDIRPSAGDLPKSQAEAFFGQKKTLGDTGLPFQAPPSYSYYWPTADLCHRPLYFQEYNLERYGQSRGILQPGISAARFFGTVPALPYLMTQRRPLSTICPPTDDPALGPLPWYDMLPPLDLRAAAVEAGVIAGLILLIP